MTLTYVTCKKRVILIGKRLKWPTPIACLNYVCMWMCVFCFSDKIQVMWLYIEHNKLEIFKKAYHQQPRLEYYLKFSIPLKKTCKRREYVHQYITAMTIHTISALFIIISIIVCMYGAYVLLFILFLLCSLSKSKPCWWRSPIYRIRKKSSF